MCRYAVLGSSLGSLCVYGACVHGWRVRGIELLPLLARHATRIAHSAGVRGVHFECADLLSCDLSASGERSFRDLPRALPLPFLELLTPPDHLSREDVVMLASQCWDDVLVAKVPSESFRLILESL